MRYSTLPSNNCLRAGFIDRQYLWDSYTNPKDIELVTREINYIARRLVYKQVVKQGMVPDSLGITRFDP